MGLWMWNGGRGVEGERERYAECNRDIETEMEAAIHRKHPTNKSNDHNHANNVMF